VILSRYYSLKKSFCGGSLWQFKSAVPMKRSWSNSDPARQGLTRYAAMPSLMGRAKASLVRRTDQFMRDKLRLRINARSLVFYYLGQVRRLGLTVSSSGALTCCHLHE